jgi:DDE superfamily endonuclease.
MVLFQRLKQAKICNNFLLDEEEALADWMLLLASWGWPVKVEQLRGMACELLQAKDDTKELGIHWTEQFLKHHLILKLKFVIRLEKDHVAAEDSDIIKAWFELVNYHVMKNAVEKEDIHNMNKKGVMMEATEKVKVIISKNEKRQYMTASGSQEWVSLIECISVIGKAQDSWIIFKDKMHKAS